MKDYHTPIHRVFIILSIVILLCPLFDFCKAQDVIANNRDSHPKDRSFNWGKAPKLDGILENDAWLPLNDPSIPNPYNNVRYIYDDKDGFSGKLIPPGYVHGEDQLSDIKDPPLDWDILIDPTNLGPVASGFNLWGVDVAYHPEIKNGSYYIAFDLPGQTNTLISDNYTNPRTTSPPLYPIAFDSDGNEDAKTWDPSWIIPQTFNEESNTESYRVILWLGDTGKAENPAGSDGLPIDIDVYSIDGSDVVPGSVKISAYIRESYTHSGNKLYFSNYASFGGVPSLPHAAEPVFDIEVELSNIFDKILTDTDINWEKVMATHISDPLLPQECRKVMVEVLAGSQQDISAEETFFGRIEFEELPIDVDIIKLVGCGECGYTSGSMSNQGYALPDSIVRFELDILVPDKPTTTIPNMPPVNGSGTIHIKDLMEDNLNLIESWNVCTDEITLNGITNKVDVPTFNLGGVEFVLKDKITDDPYIFERKDHLIIPFEVKIKDGYKTHDVKNELKNFVNVWGENTTSDNQGPYEKGTSDAKVDVLVPEIHCEKTVEVSDSNSNLWKSYNEGPPAQIFDELHVPENVVFPITVTWRLWVSNADSHVLDPNAKSGETYLNLYSVEDPVLQNIGWPGGALPKSMDPGLHHPLTYTKIYNTWGDWLKDAPGSSIKNTFEAFAHVVEIDPRPNIDHICVVKKYYPSTIYANTYEQYCTSNVTLILDEPKARVGIIKEVSCSSNGPWYEFPDPNNLNSHVDSLPSQFSNGHKNKIYFRIRVWNKDKGIPIDHAYLDDTISGPFILDTFPPNGDIGSIGTGDGNPDETTSNDTKVFLFDGTIEDGITSSNKIKDILNKVTVDADGPDQGSDPDNGSESSDEDEAWVNIRLPELEIRKRVYVEDSNGWNSGTFENEVYLPEEIVFPIICTYRVELKIPDSILLIDGLDIEAGVFRDELIEKLDSLLITPPVFKPKKPPIDFKVKYGNGWFEVLESCEFKIENSDEFKFIAKQDHNTVTDLIIENQSEAIYDLYKVPSGQSSNDLCGSYEGKVVDQARIHLHFIPTDVPALSTYGFIILSMVLGALIIIRMRVSS